MKHLFVNDALILTRIDIHFLFFCESGKFWRIYANSDIKNIHLDWRNWWINVFKQREKSVLKSTSPEKKTMGHGAMAAHQTLNL
jgi:hypothetical protein